MGMNEFESYNKRANIWFYDAQRSDVTNFSHYKKKKWNYAAWYLSSIPLPNWQ